MNGVSSGTWPWSTAYAYGSVLIAVPNYNEARVTQTAIRYDYGVYTRVRADGTWGDWAKVDSFGCTTAADLASLLGGEFIEGDAGYNKSPDDFLSMFGARRCRNNIPEYAGSVAVVFCIGISTTGYYEQICIGSNGVILKRTKPGIEANWQNWTEL